MDDNNNYPFILYNVFNFEYVDVVKLLLLLILLLLY